MVNNQDQEIIFIVKSFLYGLQEKYHVFVFTRMNEKMIFYKVELRMKLLCIKYDIIAMTTKIEQTLWIDLHKERQQYQTIIRRYDYTLLLSRVQSPKSNSPAKTSCCNSEFH